MWMLFATFPAGWTFPANPNPGQEQWPIKYTSQQLALATNHAFSQEPSHIRILPFHNNFIFDEELLLSKRQFLMSNWHYL
jgi:hypothetical protein